MVPTTTPVIPPTPSSGTVSASSAHSRATVRTQAAGLPPPGTQSQAWRRFCLRRGAARVWHFSQQRSVLGRPCRSGAALGAATVSALSYGCGSSWFVATPWDNGRRQGIVEFGVLQISPATARRFMALRTGSAILAIRLPWATPMSGTCSGLPVDQRDAWHKACRDRVKGKRNPSMYATANWACCACSRDRINQEAKYTLTRWVK